ncbi:MAG: hypothetical protein HFI14_01165 [Lachnospiraceae bacterium]|nr:hypothetical protein [Lachnospiraceae bacterium]
MKENKILEQLKREALYAQRSFSTELLYQTYGKAQMARHLEVLTQSEFMEINDMTVYFMNTDREYIRHKNKEFFENARFAAS